MTAAESIPRGRHWLRLDVIRAVYFAVRNHARILNMSFSFRHRRWN
jgi:hypothetical protein